MWQAASKNPFGCLSEHPFIVWNPAPGNKPGQVCDCERESTAATFRSRPDASRTRHRSSYSHSYERWIASRVEEMIAVWQSGPSFLARASGIALARLRPHDFAPHLAPIVSGCQRLQGPANVPGKPYLRDVAAPHLCKSCAQPERRVGGPPADEMVATTSNIWLRPDEMAAQGQSRYRIAAPLSRLAMKARPETLVAVRFRIISHRPQLPATLRRRDEAVETHSREPNGRWTPALGAKPPLRASVPKTNGRSDFTTLSPGAHPALELPLDIATLESAKAARGLDREAICCYPGVQ